MGMSFKIYFDHLISTWELSLTYYYYHYIMHKVLGINNHNTTITRVIHTFDNYLKQLEVVNFLITYYYYDLHYRIASFLENVPQVPHPLKLHLSSKFYFSLLEVVDFS